MKLKEIKQGMAIHCNTQNEYKRLDEEVKNLGLGSLPIRFNENQFDSNYIYIITDFDVVWTDRMSREHIEFSDLIIPEPELSAEEALLAYDKMCKENYCCNDCPIYGILGHECARKMDGHIGEIVDAIKKWKSDHERKNMKSRQNGSGRGEYSRLKKMAVTIR